MLKVQKEAFWQTIDIKQIKTVEKVCAENGITLAELEKQSDGVMDEIVEGL